MKKNKLNNLPIGEIIWYFSFTAWPYDLAYKWNLINKTNKQNTTRDIEIKNRLTVTREEGGEG